MLSFDIIDPHYHSWDLDRGYPWLQERAGHLRVHGDDTAIRKNYLIDDFLVDTGEVPVTRAVCVEAGASHPVAEAQWLQQVADQREFPNGIVAFAALEAPDIRDTLDRHTTHANVRGIRQILNWHPDPALTYVDRPDMMSDPAWRAGFVLLAEYGLSFDLQLYPSQMLDASRLARAFPETTIVLNHAGMPLGRGDIAHEQWHAGMLALAAAPNVMVKISGLGMTDHHWSLDSIAPYVLETIEIFGVSRCMFASNFPVDRLYSSYEELYGAFDELTADFTGYERHQLFHDNAARVYRL